MLGPFKALLVDIGNTQIKYALVNQIEDTNDIHYCQTVEALGEYIPVVDQILVSCVGDSCGIVSLTSLAEQCHTPIRFVQTQAEQFGVRCAYQNFSTLGVDRWLAVLAAEQETRLPCAVLDLGTANTCDILVDKQHHGGWIAPGFSLMRESLLINTQKVFADNSYPTELTLGVETQACVSMGCLAAQQGFVLLAEEYLASRYKEYVLFVTGGMQSNKKIASNLNVLMFKNLVIRGLFRFIENK